MRSDVAAAVGAGLDLAAPEAKLVVDVGAGKITATLFTFGRIAAFGYLPYGMNRADEAVRDLVRARENLIISPRVCRMLKHTAFSQAGEALRVAAFDPVSRLPRYVSIDPACVQPSLNAVIAGILEMCRSALYDLTPECAQDALEDGIALCGGGALLPELDASLSEALGVPVSAVSDPAEAAARGLKLILDEQELYSPLIFDWQEAGLRL